MYLTNFHSIRPKYEGLQDESLVWLEKAYEKAGHSPLVLQEIQRVGCKSSAIEKRGTVLYDYLHLEWEKMDIYKIGHLDPGANLKERMLRFGLEAEKILDLFYENETSAPDDLIHITCTGYVSPSAAQSLVSKKNWPTLVTHAYHMGCNGAFPALRMARGFLASSASKQRIDLVHTEICSLHSNPLNPRLDQIVCQTLFADGFIRYEMKKESALSCLEIINIHETIIPDSLESMRWDISSYNFEMKLAKELPVQIAKALPQFLEKLEVDKWMKDAIFAIHPGGPKILQQIQKRLNLQDEQIRHSVHVLKNAGNMSSATVPHIWKNILEDPTVKNDTPIVSLAFGPGLTICGALLIKKCGGQL